MQINDEKCMYGRMFVLMGLCQSVCESFCLFVMESSWLQLMPTWECQWRATEPTDSMFFFTMWEPPYNPICHPVIKHCNGKSPMQFGAFPSQPCLITGLYSHHNIPYSSLVPTFSRKPQRAVFVLKLSHPHNKKHLEILNQWFLRDCKVTGRDSFRIKSLTFHSREISWNLEPVGFERHSLILQLRLAKMVLATESSNLHRKSQAHFL